jgi:hypothetical protein
VVHIDVALPLSRSGDISKAQLLVKTNSSF